MKNTQKESEDYRKGKRDAIINLARDGEISYETGCKILCIEMNDFVKLILENSSKKM